MLDTHLLRCSRVAQLELRVGCGDQVVPFDLAFIDELRQQQSRHAFGVRGGHEQRVGIDRIGLTEFLYPVAAFVHNLAVFDERHADTGNVKLLHCRLDEFLHLREALGVQRPGFASREGFALIRARPQTPHNQTNGGSALFERGLLAVEEHDCPGILHPACHRLRHSPFIGRSFVDIDLNLFPSFAGGGRKFLPDSAFFAAFVCSPGCVNGGFCRGGIRIEDNDMRISFRRLDDNERSGSRHRPPAWSRKSSSAGCGDLFVGGKFLGRRRRGLCSCSKSAQAIKEISRCANLIWVIPRLDRISLAEQVKGVNSTGVPQVVHSPSMPQSGREAAGRPEFERYGEELDPSRHAARWSRSVPEGTC